MTFQIFSRSLMPTALALSIVLCAIAVPAQTLDAFNPNPNSQVFDALALSDGKTMIMGSLSQINGVAVQSLARLNADGTRDTSYTSPITQVATTVDMIYPLSNGKYLISGGFENVGGTQILRIARLNADFTADTSYNLNVSTPVGVGRGALMPDEKLVIGFTFGSTIALRRLNTDGSNDTSFTPPAFNSSVARVSYDSSAQKLYVSGAFTTVAGATRRGLARLNSNGTLDTAFAAFPADAGAIVDSVVVLPSGKVLVSGRFANVGGDSTRNYICRLNSDGTVDTTFTTPAFGGTSLGVYDMELLPSGKILIVGTFDTISGIARAKLARLNADGTLDQSFRNMGITGSSATNIKHVGTNKYIFGLPSGTTIDGSTRNYMARITIDDELAPVAKTPFDFDGDGKADVSVYRDGTWFLDRSTAGFGAAQFGVAGDRTAPGDYDGDGKADIAVFRSGTWYWLKSSDNSFSAAQFGQSGDLPTPGDYTGDGRDELSVYRGGTWYSLDLTNGGFQAVQFGLAADRPVNADFDGDGKTDRAVYRPSDGVWHMLRSTAGYTGIQFGISTDKAVVADYDGDGKADPAVYRGGTWFVLGSQQGFFAAQFGIATDTPVPADYDGDGKADLAIYRDGTWWLSRTTAGVTAVSFGIATDKPVPSSFVY